MNHDHVAKILGGHLQQQGEIMRGLDASVREAMRKVQAFAMMNTTLDLFRKHGDILRAREEAMRKSFELAAGPMSQLQRAIRDATRSVEFLKMTESIRKNQAVMSKLFSECLSLPTLKMSQALNQSLAMSNVWQSIPVKDLMQRLAAEAKFREQFSAQVVDAIQQAPSVALPIPPEAQILRAIEEGIQESGLTQAGSSAETGLRRLFDWLKNAEPAIRNAALQILFSLIAAILFAALFQQDSPKVTNVSIKQDLRIVQNAVCNVVINLNLPLVEVRQIRIVAVKSLHVYRSPRRDSERMGTIGVPQIVFLKSKRRNWSEITWIDPLTGDQHEGWTHTRYLKPL